METIVGTVRSLRLEAHGRIVAATSLLILVERTRTVPRETQENRPKGTVIIVASVIDLVGNFIVHLLIVRFCWSKLEGGLCGLYARLYICSGSV